MYPSIFKQPSTLTFRVKSYPNPLVSCPGSWGTQRDPQPHREKGPDPGIKSKTFLLWGDSANRCTTALSSDKSEITISMTHLILIYRFILFLCSFHLIKLHNTFFYLTRPDYSLKVNRALIPLQSSLQQPVKCVQYSLAWSDSCRKKKRKEIRVLLVWQEGRLTWTRIVVAWCTNRKSI